MSGPMGLNPFENQVYFYKKDKDLKWGDMVLVLIPLRIRSISTLERGQKQGAFIVLIPLRIRSISTYVVAVEDPATFTES